MAHSMKDRNVVITGSASGIGAACALKLDALGCRVFAGVRRESDGEALKAKASERLTPILLDVTREEQIADAAALVAESVGEDGLDGLVNNAGVVVAGPLEFLPIAELKRQMDVNVIGVMAVTQALLPLLRRARGRIVSIGSVSGRISTPFVGPYAASKFALEGMTDSLRMELKPWGIEIALVEPGAIATPLWRKSRDTAEALAETLPEECDQLYGPALDKLRVVVEKVEQMAVPPEKVARVVVRALTVRRPKTRYLVGRGARLQVWMARHLSDRLRDTLLLRVMGIR